MSDVLSIWKLGIHKGKWDERERIIKIIENALIDSEGFCHANTIIASIKKDNDAE